MMIECVKFIKEPVIQTDNWIPAIEDELFKSSKGAIIAPVSRMYGLAEDDKINFFILSPKKCYNSDDMRNHTTKYINYFEKYYDVRYNQITGKFESELEYFSIISQMKYLIDYEPSYTSEQFMMDIQRYILSNSMLRKVNAMVEDNYYIHLKYKNPKNPALEYSDNHGKMLMAMSILMNLCIPIMTHFAYMKKVEDIDEFLLEVYDKIFRLFPVDMYNKLYETSITNISEKARNDEELWAKQDIRGINVVTHSQNAVRNIILNIIPKYVFDSSVVSLNFVSIKNTTKYTIDVEYEFGYVPLSSSKRDEDSTSEYDKYESYLIKQNEALLIQNEANAEATMRLINQLYGPFSQEEVDFYIESLGDYDSQINPFQNNLVFLLFYKYFGDPNSAKAINRIDYIQLIIAAKRILLSGGMKMLPYVIGGKPDKIIVRKAMNKKDIVAMEASPLYPLVLERYNGNTKIVKEIQAIISTIIVSDFSYIDYDIKEINGIRIDTIPQLIIEEVLMFALMI